MDLFYAIKTRRSIRNYSETNVSKELIEKIIEAGTYAPSGANLQPWRFIVVDDAEIKKNIAAGARFYFVKSHHVYEAPILIVCLADLRKSKWAVIDVSLACQNIMLAAHALGLGSCFIGLFDENKTKQILKIPDNFKVVGLITLGYPSRKEDMPPRLPLSDVLFFNGFNQRNRNLKSFYKRGPISVWRKILRLIFRIR